MTNNSKSMTPRDLLSLAAEQQVRVGLDADGELTISGPPAVVRQFLPAIREHRGQVLFLVRLAEAITPDPSDPGRRWAAGNPFRCANCYNQTGFLRDERPLCPVCDAKEQK